jgi:hypothetical protein
MAKPQFPRSKASESPGFLATSKLRSPDKLVFSQVK